MKRFLPVLIAAALSASLIFAPRSAAAPATSDSASAMILVDAVTGKVLCGHDYDTRMGIASTTKILTALVVIGNCELSDTVTVRQEDTEVEGSSMYLTPGEELTVEDLLYGLLLESGNDAAVCLACHVSGSTDAFAELMNEKAEELGCVGSHFSNPHGLDAPDHYSTARDLARIASAAMQNENLRAIFSTKSVYAAGREMTNHNKLLWTCEGAVGLKTGYTSSCGRTLVSCAEREGMSIVCVTLNDRNDWEDHIRLYDWGFENFGRAEFSESFTIPVVSGVSGEVTVSADRKLCATVSGSDLVETKITLPHFVYAPVAEGEAAGRAAIYVNGTEVCAADLTFDCGVALDDAVLLTPWERFLRLLFPAVSYMPYNAARPFGWWI